MRRIALFLVLAACARRTDPAWTQAPAKQAGDPTVTGEPAHVGKLASPITIDGKLDEAAWQSATALGPFVDPGSGNEISSPVEGFARALWDESKLYFGFIVRDRSPFSPFGRDEVDPHIWEKSSAVEIMIQPGDPGDNRDYYELQVDIQGAVFDTHWDDYNVPQGGAGDAKTFGHMNWSSKMERAVFVQNDAFYSVEVAIPWTSFVAGRSAIPPKPNDVWRLDLYSFRDNQSKSLAWSPIRGQGNFHKSARWGRIKFQ
jgi:hypothetical protein